MSISCKVVFFLTIGVSSFFFFSAQLLNLYNFSTLVPRFHLATQHSLYNGTEILNSRETCSFFLPWRLESAEGASHHLHTQALASQPRSSLRAPIETPPCSYILLSHATCHQQVHLLTLLAHLSLPWILKTSSLSNRCSWSWSERVTVDEEKLIYSNCVSYG